ncbi:hypothetical protein SKAU_G00284110 [Synaphobranchus kaupii]|uniref:Uncharacterized protein n=1 Tax=Synaphobranchus kaupii TaxID=118154 RepID=A0A9Q1EXR3_SYNKA|nr:hypothetical protein SKAU_G00284110 [Synaphobranchus kaupii]
MLRVQALTEDQQVEFLLGALEGTARREVRWCEQEPGGDEENDILLRDQFLLGLEDGPVKRKLQWQVPRQDSLTFRQVTKKGGVSEPDPRTSLATREPPVRLKVDLEQWKEEVKNKLRQELQDQLAALGRTLVAELRQQCAPGLVAPSSGGTEAQGADNNHPYAPFSDGTSEEGPSMWRCGTCAAEVPHSPPSSEFVKRQPLAMLGSARLTLRDPVQVPARSEVVRWAQVSGGGLAEGQCELVEGVKDGGEWKVARGLVWVRGGRVLLRIVNVHPFPIELPRLSPLATIASIDPSQGQGGPRHGAADPQPQRGGHRCSDHPCPSRGREPTRPAGG